MPLCGSASGEPRSSRRRGGSSWAGGEQAVPLCGSASVERGAVGAAAAPPGLARSRRCRFAAPPRGSAEQSAPRRLLLGWRGAGGAALRLRLGGGRSSWRRFAAPPEGSPGAVGAAAAPPGLAGSRQCRFAAPPGGGRSIWRRFAASLAGQTCLFAAKTDSNPQSSSRGPSVGSPYGMEALRTSEPIPQPGYGWLTIWWRRWDSNP